jgi:hypothetical protein
MTMLDRKNIIIKRNIRNFPIIELTQQEYEMLDDYSISVPVSRAIGDIGKIPGLQFLGERLVDMVISEEKGQIMHCEIIEVKT